LGSPVHDTVGQVKHKAAKTVRGLEHTTYKKGLRELGLFGLEKKGTKLLFSTTKWGLLRGDGARLFLVQLKDKGHILQQ